MRKASVAWSYFTKTDEDRFLADCDVCKKTFSYRHSPSNLIKHLKRAHKLLLTTDVEDITDCETDPETSASIDIKPSVTTNSQYHQKQFKSKSWKWFKVVDPDARTARCRFCKRILSFRASVSNLYKHLKKIHSNKLHKLSSISDDSSDESVSEIKSNNDDSDKEEDQKVDEEPEWKYFRCLSKRLKIFECTLCQSRFNGLKITTVRKHMMMEHPNIAIKNIPVKKTKFVTIDKKLYEYVDNRDLIMMENSDDGDDEHYDDGNDGDYEYNDESIQDTIYIAESPPSKRKRKSMSYQKVAQDRISNIKCTSTSNKEPHDKSSLEYFALYLTSLLSELPEEKSKKLQGSFINQVMEAQASALAAEIVNSGYTIIVKGDEIGSDCKNDTLDNGNIVSTTD